MELSFALYGGQLFEKIKLKVSLLECLLCSYLIIWIAFVCVYTVNFLDLYIILSSGELVFIVFPIVLGQLHLNWHNVSSMVIHLNYFSFLLSDSSFMVYSASQRFWVKFKVQLLPFFISIPIGSVVGAIYSLSPLDYYKSGLFHLISL